MCKTAYCHNCLVMETAYGWFQVHLPLIARIYMEKLDGAQLSKMQRSKCCVKNNSQIHSAHVFHVTIVN